MANVFPGTAVETNGLQKGTAKTLLDGIFAAGGVTLSQVSVMTGLEPYLIQNWVKRGFVSPPVKRLYSREQFARIAIINMMREVLQMERICAMLQPYPVKEEAQRADVLRDDELYCLYADLLAEQEAVLPTRATVQAAAERVASETEKDFHGSKKQLERALQVMFYAHAAAGLRGAAEETLSAMQ